MICNMTYNTNTTINGTFNTNSNNMVPLRGNIFLAVSNLFAHRKKTTLASSKVLILFGSTKGISGITKEENCLTSFLSVSESIEGSNLNTEPSLAVADR